MSSTLRLAQVHLMRCGGTFTAQVLDAVLPADCRREHSWFHGYERDWTVPELERLLHHGGPMYVHNHVVNWNAELVRRFQARGFLVFAFVRSPLDQLTSLYRWLRNRESEMRTVTLDAFVRGQVRGEVCLDFDWRHWAIPEYWPELNRVSVFSEENLKEFLGEALGLPESELGDWSDLDRNGTTQMEPSEDEHPPH